MTTEKKPKKPKLPSTIVLPPMRLPDDDILPIVLAPDAFADPAPSAGACPACGNPKSDGAACGVCGN